MQEHLEMKFTTKSTRITGLYLINILKNSLIISFITFVRALLVSLSVV